MKNPVKGLPHLTPIARKRSPRAKADYAAYLARLARNKASYSPAGARRVRIVPPSGGSGGLPSNGASGSD
jgi:hypothetical protein